MSRIASLGLHTPAALPYCITESLLPDPPPPDSYTWTTGLPHEELLITGSAVIWSQGGVIRRVFRYDVEKEPVIQAVLTWFSSDDPQDAILHPNGASLSEEEATYVKGGGEGNKRKSQDWLPGSHTKKRVSTWNSKSRTYAAQLGNFPPKARVSGAGEMSGGAPLAAGDISEDEVVAQGRARALVILLKTQAFVYFLSGTSHVIHLPFEVEHAMPAPRGLILQRKPPAISISPPIPGFSTGNSFTARPVINTTRDTPRLFSLTDPLLEVGLIVSPGNSPSTEDLIFISPSSELEPSVSEEPSYPVGRFASNSPEVVFAVTRNPDRAQITIWHVRYIPQEPPTNTQRRTPSANSGTASARRRSSFGPGTGATTPVTGGGPGSIASSATLPNNTRESLGPSDGSSLPGLGDDFESGGKRTSRRVSSLVARADLSGNHDRGGRFSDVSGSIGTSFGGPSIPVVPANSMVVDNEQPVDELLNELNMGALGIGMGGLGIYDGEGLRNEVLMTKLDSYSFRYRADSGGAGDGGRRKLPRVFTLHASSASMAAAAVGKENSGRKVVLCIMNTEEGSLMLVTFTLQIYPSLPKGYSRRASNKYGMVGVGYTPVFSKAETRHNVLDAIKMEDHGFSRILILTEEGELHLFSPWGPSIRVVLPPTLARWNTNVVGEDGSRRGSRKKGFARTLSTSPEKYERLEYSEAGGRVTVVDGDGVGHRIGITMAPREAAVKTCLETVKVMIGASAGASAGEGMWGAWIEVARWLGINEHSEASFPGTAGTRSGQVKDPEVDEWRAFVVMVFLLAVPSLPEHRPTPRRKNQGFVRSASVVSAKEWEDMISSEGEWGSAPEYLRSAAWEWVAEEDDERILSQMARPPAKASPTKARGTSASTTEQRKMNRFFIDCISLAREFLKTPMGEAVEGEYFGSSETLYEIRKNGLAVVLVALHLIQEEWKLDVAMEGAGRRLCPLLRQLATWLGWTDWVEEYMLEDLEMVGWAFDECRRFSRFMCSNRILLIYLLARITAIDVPNQPFPAPSIYEWLIGCLDGTSQTSFMSLQDIVTSPSSPPSSQYSASSHTPRARNPFSPPPAPLPQPTQKRVFGRLTPRTRVVTDIYTTLTSPGATDVDAVARMVELKMNSASLERLPEGIAVPFREAIARCQEQPPTTWGVHALDLIGRKDLRMLIEPGKGRKDGGSKWQSVRLYVYQSETLLC